jgi:hypothetical protein
VRHIEHNILGAEVVPFSERGGQLDLPQGNHLPISDTIERHRWEQLAFPDLHLVEHLQERRFRPPPLSTRALPTLWLQIVGDTTTGGCQPRHVVWVVVPIKGNHCTPNILGAGSSPTQGSQCKPPSKGAWLSSRMEERLLRPKTAAMACCAF